MGFLLKDNRDKSFSRIVNTSKLKNSDSSECRDFRLPKEDFKWKDATKREKKEIVINAYKDFAF